MRKLVVEGSEYKVVHQELLCDLLLLSTSTYSQVKTKIKWFPFSQWCSHKSWVKIETSCACVHVNLGFCILQVRSRAQNVLMTAMGTYSFSYRDMIPRILQLLSPQYSTCTEQQFKVQCMFSPTLLHQPTKSSITTWTQNPPFLLERSYGW